MNDDLEGSQPRDLTNTLSYEDWTQRLADHFFTPEFAGEPVMFFIDDDIVAEIRGGDTEQAVAGLTEAVGRKLSRSQPRRLFRGIERATRDWRRGGGDGPPPCLPLLALAVLAASRMRRSGRYAANNYHDRFVDLLDVPFSRQEIYASYVESVPDCWRMLEWWLDERHNGGLGYSTIAEDPHFTNIGFADSQTLFSTSDQSKLARFFEWIDLVPGEPTDESELLASFKVWSAGRTDLSVGAQFMVSSETHVPQLGRILSAAARRWTGVVKADDGRNEAHILLSLDPFPDVRLTLAAERLEGFPENARYLTPSGRPVEMMSSQPGWYDSVPLEVTPSVLRSGVRLIWDTYALSLTGAEVHLLRKHEELGWASARSMTPATAHWLLVAQSRCSVVESYLDRVARPGWEPVIRAGVPQGWGAFRNVAIDAIDHVTPPDGLEMLLPTLRKRVSLGGGLPISRSRRVYLSGGEPDLWLPFAGETGVEIRMDGTHVDVPHDSTCIRLADKGPSVGNHSIDLGPVQVSFSTLRTLGRIQAHLSERVAHVLRHSGDGFEPVTPEAQGVSGSVPHGDVWISGAATFGSEQDVPLRDASPVVLPGGAQRRVLLGAHAGEIEEVHRPAKPEWMDQAGLGARVFEHVPSFEVAWVITDWWGALTKTRAASPLPPRPPSGSTDPSKVRAWQATLGAAPEPGPDDERSRWQEYLQTATNASLALANGLDELTPGVATDRPATGARQRRSPTGPRPRTPAGQPTNGAIEQHGSARRWDLLLEWVSEVGNGSFAQFREACDWTFESVERGAWQPTAGQAARRLATLGHLEIDWSARRWVVAPTTITLLPSAGAHALLTGGRTRALEPPLEDAMANEDVPLFLIQYQQRDGPTAVFIACDHERDLDWLANTLDVRYEYSVSERIARLLPSLDSYLAKAEAAPAPSRYGVDSFDPIALRWRMASTDTEPGLYRYDLPAGRAFRLIDEDGTIYALDGAKATYAALSRWGENVLKYMPDSVNGTLVVPVAAPLPVLQARAAALCCGLVPSLQGKTQWYRNVPRWLGEQIARSLDQTLVELP